MGKFLTDDQVIELRQAHRKIKERKQADRIKAILLLDEGFSYTDAAKILLLDDNTIRHYESDFLKKGLSGLTELHYKGGVSELSASQITELKEYFVINTPQTAKEASDYIKKTYKISYSLIGITKLLHRLGFVYKKPKLIPGKLNIQLQLQFMVDYEELKNQLGEKDSIYFVDSTHPTHNTKTAYGWILKGRKNDKYVKTTSGRERLNLNGALSIKERQAIVLEEKAINSQAIIHLFEAIKRKQRLGKVYIILDNAKHHHSRLIRNWLLNHPRFKLIYLPAYSPNLNIIERLWRFFHQKVTYNRYFESFKEFKEVTLAFFKNLKQYDTQLTSLLSDKFQLFPA